MHNQSDYYIFCTTHVIQDYRNTLEILISFWYVLFHTVTGWWDRGKQPNFTISQEDCATLAKPSALLQINKELNK